MTAVLSPEQARWLLEVSPSITVASTDGQGGSSLAQGIGVALDERGERVRVLMVEARNRAAVSDLRAGRPIAVVFTHAPTLRSLQLKAKRATEVAVAAEDLARVDAYVEATVASWVTAPEAFVRTLLAKGPGPIVAFELEPTAAFDQTPGPKAGAALPETTR